VRNGGRLGVDGKLLHLSSSFALTTCFACHCTTVAAANRNLNCFVAFAKNEESDTRAKLQPAYFALGEGDERALLATVSCAAYFSQDFPIAIARRRHAPLPESGGTHT
jgi:hypothetical protein